MIKSYSISLDVSTTNVGLALWNEKGELAELKHLQLKVKEKGIPSEDRYIYKGKLLEEYLIDFKNRIEDEYSAKIETIFIEAPFANTPKNINTTALLLGFNGQVCWMLYQIFNIVPVKITVYDSRKLFCPEFIKLKKQKGKMKKVLSFPKGWKSKEKKEYIRKKVAELEPQIKWFYTRNDTIKDTSYDMSDAYVVGYSGLKILKELESVED